MRITLPSDTLLKYVHHLVALHFPDGYMPCTTDSRDFKQALERVEHCFKKINKKYYTEAGEPVFNHLNGDHMAVLLYFYANTVWRERCDTTLPTRLFYLNKILHGIDLFYSVSMPEIFLLVHPLGTVLGHAKYGNYLVVYQNCTVGAVSDIYPSFGEGTILYARSSVIGNCTLGDNVVLGANAFLVDCTIPANTVVVGQYPALRYTTNSRSVRERCFETAEPNK
jgi:serine O-acetyltransferase